jgi:hypothetical protein
MSQGELDATPDPPVVLFLPGLSTQPRNSALRVAELLRRELSRGPGSFTVQGLDGPQGADGIVTDGRRIADQSGAAVLDVYAVDYRSRLRRTVADSPGLMGIVRSLWSQLWYFWRMFLRFFLAGRRAKGKGAKWQLVVGAVAVCLQLAVLVLTVLAVLAALGVYDLPHASPTFTDALAIGLTAMTTWAVTRLGPSLRQMAGQVQLLLDYVEDMRYAQGVNSALGDALDVLLEAEPGRRVHVFGYSLGSLAAYDYLYPRESGLVGQLDPRHRDAVRTLLTVGCPIDFVRFFVPEYETGRIARVPGLRWVNVFIPADLLGSNVRDGDDNHAADDEQSAGEQSAGEQATDEQGEIGVFRPTRSYRYTDEELGFGSVLSHRGFLSHAGYWDGPADGHCLGVVLDVLGLRDAPTVATPQPI